jgi:predicted dehydrogenase
MIKNTHVMTPLQDRRTFIKGSMLAAGSLAASAIPGFVGAYAGAWDTIRVALVGCGGRGTGAINDALGTGRDIRLVAMADAFRERLDQSYTNLVELRGTEQVAVPEDHKFVGLDGYKHAIALADVVVLATPPGFRPLHFEEAVNQGKHVFMEKPVATDVPGIRKVLDMARVAQQKGLKVAVGHQLRHQGSCLESVQRLHDGMIGDLLAMRSYFHSGGVWVRDRKPGMSEMQYQVWNWYYFNWLSGDHIVEQHVHNLDFINWVKNAHPVSAQGMGGREVRTGKEYGEIYDHHYVEYTYPDGSILNSQCRHIKGCWHQWADGVQGTNGSFYHDPAMQNATIRDKQGNVLFDYRGKDDAPARRVIQEVFYDRIRKDEPIDMAEAGATSTMTAILGRLATYSGQVVTWDEAMGSTRSLMPERYAWDAEPPVVPDAEGRYPVPVPGKTPVL